NHYRSYRDSSSELYADAVSVFLLSPGSLQERAPAFFDAFLAYAERKKEVFEAYDAIQDLLAKGEEAIYEARKEETLKGYARGEEIIRESEQREDPQSFLSYLKQTWIDRGAPLIDAERRRVKRTK